MAPTMEKIISLCKRRGFAFLSSELYGGFASCYDYGPLGVELKNNIKQAWWQAMVREQENIVGLDSAILMSPKVWQASGHLTAGFADELVECKKCHSRFRADHLIESFLESQPDAKESLTTDPSGWPAEKIQEALNKFIDCPKCDKREWTKPNKFNLMMKTFVGPVENEAAVTYLRAETCQGIYMNYRNILDSTRMKIPFGIAQIGKAFRNEITPGNFFFRTREFEQMEMQFFINPKESKKWFECWKKQRMDWYLALGVKKENLRFREHEKDELAHYAKEAFDIEYKFPFGWKEIEGIHNRGDWDLSNHAKHSGEDLSYLDETTKEKYIPHVIETSVGAERSMLVFLIDAYQEIEGGRTETTKSAKKMEAVLNLHPSLASVKVAILPLVKNKPELVKKAKEVFDILKPKFACQYDEVGSIGRRYRRQDEIGTPFALTVDFDSLEKNDLTLRDRDTMKQERVKIEKIKDILEEKLG